MKKVYDYNIRVKVSVPESKKNFSYVVSIHSTIKELNTKIAQAMQLDPFITNFDFYFNDWYVLPPESTIQQNNIVHGSTLTAKLTIADSKNFISPAQKLVKNKLLQINDIPNYNVKTQSTIYGLCLEGICINDKCIAYGKDMVYNIGCGEFGFNQIMHGTKCPACPYRDREINPPIVVKSIKLTNCMFKFYGKYRDKGGFIGEQNNPLYTKVYGMDQKKIYQVIDGKQWTDLVLVIKQL